jgi:hypothetical protein
MEGMIPMVAELIARIVVMLLSLLLPYLVIWILHRTLLGSVADILSEEEMADFRTSSRYQVGKLSYAKSAHIFRGSDTWSLCEEYFFDRRDRLAFFSREMAVCQKCLKLYRAKKMTEV